MLSIYSNAVLSCDKEGNTVEHEGALQFYTGYFEFTSPSYGMRVCTEKIEYIAYGSDVFLIVSGDSTDYTIICSDIASVQESINALLRNWLLEQRSAEALDAIYDKGVPLSLISEWIVSTDCMGHISALVKDNTPEGINKAKTMLTTMSKVEEKPVILELSNSLQIISTLFGIAYKETSEIEKYVSDPEIRKCNDLHWLRKYFYGIHLGLIKVPILDEMIQRSQERIVSKILPKISITAKEVRKVFEELHDPQTLSIFIRQLNDTNILLQIESLKSVDEVYILYYIALNDRNILYSYAVDRPQTVETIIHTFLSKIEEKDLEAVVPLQAVIEILLAHESVELSIVLSEYLPALFEEAGSKSIKTINGWPQVSNGHRLSIYHLQLLNSLVKQPTVHMRLYIITSGIALSVTDKIRAESAAEKYLSSSIILSLISRENDRILMKYINTLNIPQIARDTIVSTEPCVGTAYYPVMLKILQTV
ncbi:hypothetical protein NEMIN01_0649 [Nematocida minor]|uniref:uncharacterized protein n=1 Tax=Nematocida minor TaxID=1912983 RepID=UPI00221FF0F5|nr:uncharacterized protein NEMIN01_0649 [Nematocida minor]KAI5189696.1 hypothetical protein NEMIN01_0649 [Nematocida minor]